MCSNLEAQTLNVSKTRWTVLFIVVMSTFMATLDSSIVNVALPVIGRELHVTSGEIAWVVSSYLITIAAAILVFGRYGDLKGKSNVFKYGLAVFTVGSFLCGLTHSLFWLVVSRIVQAVGAACTMANSQGIITQVFPPNERGRALGISGTFVALGTLVGPALGGFIVDVSRWEYIFWINIPIGIIVFLFSLRFLPKKENRIKSRLDVPGAALFIFAIVPLFVSLGQVEVVGYFNPFMLVALSISLVSFVLFIIVEKKSQSPLLDLGLFKNKWFSISIFCGFISFVAMFCSTIVQPFYLQDVLKLSPGAAGLYMTIFPLVLAVVAPVSGYLSDKIGSELLTLIGLFFTGVGLFLLSTLDEHPAYAMMVLFIAIMSLGNGMFQSPNTSLIMSTLPRDKLGIGGSVNALVRNLGMVSGIALSTSLLYGGMSNKLGYHVSGYVEGRSDAFIYGMRIVYITAACICLIGVAVTAFRLVKRRAKTVNPD
ncbi:MAG: MFS transporter [Bacillota bacterium]